MKECPGDRDPVGGATCVPYTRRSADGKVLRRDLAGFQDRKDDFGRAQCRQSADSRFDG